MKPILLFLFVFTFFYSPNINAQNIPVEISGVINDFAKVNQIDYCSSELSLSSTDGFEVGIPVVLVQAKGANIKSGNNSSFGEIEALNNTGMHETNVVNSISGNKIFLKHEILNTYDVENGAVQLVTMPAYEDVEVNNLLTTDAWNGNVGGVLALRVTNILTLNADIDVSGMGFRGGEMASVANNCNGGINNANNYSYETGNWRGANKGEGIAQFIAGKELGKGAQATGGGGGNDHNSGGGGGSNVTEGGNGGERETPFLTTSCKGEHPGRGGRSISDVEGRVFFGSGGGAGHTNNQVGSGGGSGGGIIIIQTKTIIANDHKIISNGITPALVTAQDGAGGGGAGGTILLEAENVMGDLAIECEGGNGGSINHDDSNQCFGAGGGGSGGRYLSTLNSNNVQVSKSGGTAGLSSSNSNSCTNVTNGAQNGQNGVEASFEGILQGVQLGGPTMILEQPNAAFQACSGMPTSLTVVAQGLNLEYQWQVNQGNGFNDIMDNDIYSGSTTPTLTLSEVTNDMLGFTYLLVVNSTCSDENDISDFITIEMIDSPLPNFEYTANGREVTFNNLSQNADDYLWSFGTGDSSTTENPMYTFAEDGQYYVTLSVSNHCGSFEVSEFVSIGTLPNAAFEMSETEGCSPLTVEFSNFSSSNSTGYLWLFEGGTPATSTAENPVVSFESGGSYNVTLIAGNETGNDTLHMVDVINIDAGPTTSFFVDVNELEVSFNNATGNGFTYIWDFGDNVGNSTEVSPTYTYQSENEYTASLIATNDCGSNTYSLDFTTGALPNSDFTVLSGVGCTPLYVEYNNQSSGTNVGNWQWEFEGGIPATSTEESPRVEYPNPGIYKTKLTVSNNLGSSNMTKEEFITVYDQPDATFTYEINDGVVTFMGNGENATNFGWNFGDGTFSNELNPVHTYANSGVHAVTFTATNPSCGNSFTELINITLSGLEDVEDLPEISIYPNPAREQITLWLENEPIKDLKLELYNVNGQVVQTDAQKVSNAYQIYLRDVPQGVYFLKIITEEWQTVRKITKQ